MPGKRKAGDESTSGLQLRKDYEHFWIFFSIMLSQSAFYIERSYSHEPNSVINDNSYGCFELLFYVLHFLLM